MSVFEDLQNEKVERAKRLLNILHHTGMAEELGQKIVLQKSLNLLAEHLNILLNKIKEQKKLCGKNNQCIVLLDDEIEALSGRNRILGTSVIDHVVQAAAGLVNLEVLPVSKALLLIVGREKSLSGLYQSEGIRAAAA